VAPTNAFEPNRRSIVHVAAALYLAASVALLMPGGACAQDHGGVSAATVDTTLEAGDGDVTAPRRQLVKWNQFDGPISTLRFGAHFMYDFATHAQDDESKQQFHLEPDQGTRDFRVIFSGRFKTERPITWAFAYRYDGAEDDWYFRTTGIQVDLPEISGRVFVGRTKEGYSLIKLSSGAFIWGLERSQVLDAFVPILADGIRYMGYYAGPRILLNVGLYADWLSENEAFSTDDNQIVTRLGWQPVLSEEQRTVFHVAVMGRRAKPDEGQVREKSRPGSFLDPFFLDTGTFPAERAHTYGLEGFYRRGSVLFMAEYNWQKDDATTGEKPTFHGGNAAVVWLVTGETRPYNAPGGFLEAVSPNRTVFEGGPGAIELGLDLTYSDFDSGSFLGGKFWRLTPIVGWHLSDNLRWTFVYGVGELDRFGTKGTTQFFQTRFQVRI
jgi:phosphate-selective porin OprO/OprP